MVDTKTKKGAARPPSDIKKRSMVRDGKLLLEKVQDVEPTIKQARALADIHGGRVDPDAYHVARVPVVVLERWMKKRGVTFADFQRDPLLVKELVNDPELRAFRVFQGRV